ncbi:hypothetical protein [Streptomyces sp. CA-111067]|uniref:hypothetical protein n=1 Tax=Streptomyces sp. CA-111067 TaxID=3240046 RepID=UPI003D95BEDB
MIRGRTRRTGELDFYDDGDPSTTVASVTADGVTGAVPGAAPTAADVTAEAISPGTATDVQGILAELAARITALEAP